MTNVPSWPRMTATIKVQAVAPMANPRIRMRPSNVPMATARKMKISGAFVTTCCIQVMESLHGERSTPRSPAPIFCHFTS